MLPAPIQPVPRLPAALWNGLRICQHDSPEAREGSYWGARKGRYYRWGLDTQQAPNILMARRTRPYTGRVGDAASSAASLAFGRGTLS